MIAYEIQLRYDVTVAMSPHTTVVIWVTITSVPTVTVCTCGLNFLDNFFPIITKRFHTAISVKATRYTLFFKGTRKQYDKLHNKMIYQIRMIQIEAHK